jgi:hypothetical protein
MLRCSQTRLSLIGNDGGCVGNAILADDAETITDENALRGFRFIAEQAIANLGLRCCFRCFLLLLLAIGSPFIAVCFVGRLVRM